MQMVKLKDGSLEMVGNYRDLVDIIRDKCGDDVAKIVEENNPDDWEDVYTAYENIMSVSDLLNKEEYEENDIECAKILLNKAIDLLADIL